MDQEQQEWAAMQHEQTIEQTANQVATDMAAQEAQHTVKNPRFLEELKESGIDSGVFDWLESELGPLVSGGQIVGNRGEHFEEQQEYLNPNAIERMIAERTPGRLLRENPEINAVMQGITGWEMGTGPESDPRYRTPISSRKRRVLREAAQVLTSRQSLAVGGRGLDAVANATVENRKVSNKERQEGAVTSRAKEVFR
jgi:hypothetical protein